MIDRFIGWFAPHICEGCGAVGSALCERCNKNILAKPYIFCIQCLSPIGQRWRQKHGNICSICRSRLPFDRVSVVGERVGTLEHLVGNFKYLSRRGSAIAIAKLLTTTLPAHLPDNMQIIFVPSSPKNIRERGFDHMKLVAKQLAKERHAEVKSIIKRFSNQAQHSASRTGRLKQAEIAFGLENKLAPERALLIDDIYTTGTTVQAIAKLLHQAGTDEIWLAIIARQRPR